MITATNITDLSLEYMRVTGEKEVTVSYWVFSDSKKLTAIRHGADLTVNRFNIALAWFDENWPPQAVWPKGVQRPRHGEAAA